MDTVDALEQERRQAKFRQVEAEWRRWREDLPPSGPDRPTAAELTALLDELARQPDLDRFRQAWSGWARLSEPFPNGGRRLALNTALQLMANDPTAFEILVDALRLPTDEDEAAVKIRRLHETVTRLRQGSQPAPNMMPLIQSTFWSRQAPDAWPALWTDGELILQQYGWLAYETEPVARYLTYRRATRALAPSATHAADVLSWYSGHHPFCGLDLSLVERCRENAITLGEWHARSGYASPEDERAAAGNAITLRAEMNLTNLALRRRIELALGTDLRQGSMSLETSTSPGRPYRADGFCALYFPSTGAPGALHSLSFRIWVTRDGVAVGLHPSWVSDNYNQSGQVAESQLPTDLCFMRVLGHGEDGRIVPGDRRWPGGQFLVGRWFPGTTALDRVDFADDVAGVAEALRPTAEALLALSRSDAEPPADVSDPTSDIDPVATLADDLLLDPSFLEDIVGLLREKRQIILYGPPGTGKTYVAKRLAEALAPDVERRMIVQFHPSTSYEDFFEGFRPQSDGATGLSYTLAPGPLALLSEAARTQPGDEHVMVIDEINRGNLPRILGELLFLLEYRDESVRTLYRPDAPFSLPRNVLFIGTMNTADRSIALVDAALRRRFHFIPFFPHEGPLADLLRRWLEREQGPVWVADLLDMVNAELRQRLGGPHLQVGPSHFMTQNLDEVRLRRIWDYSVFPFIEEQLYGDWGAVDAYRFEAVHRRFRTESEIVGGPLEDAVSGDPWDNGEP
ncbi:MAG: AAA family ATPase [Ardenticatenales bacterium]|nr:AAA family ATPase [Ardenticatenales bacterium]